MAWTTVISPQALFARLGDPETLVVDCRHVLAEFTMGRRLYEESHVPGAFFAAVEEDLSGVKTGTNGRHPLPDPKAFAEFLRGLGANDTTQLIAYDAGADMFAPRFWFLTRWIGHDAVAVLDGGFAAWTDLGFPVTAELSRPARRGDLTVRLRPEYIVDAAYVHEHLEDPRMRLLDARARERYSGEVEPIDPVAGHIPGAANRWFKENFGPDGRFKSPTELRAEFERAGLDPQRTVHQCGSGVSAAASHLAMEHAGLAGSRVYNGSWSEWVADPSRPVADGDEG